MSDQIPYSGHPDQWFGSSTYSQHGEDLLIVSLFIQLGIPKPTFLDIGAHHPINISNTYLMYKRGSRGINVEANNNLIADFHKQRSDDKTICVGISPEPGPRCFYMYDEKSGRNTFCPEEVQKMKPNLSVKHEQKIETRTMYSIVEEYADGKYPDFLSIDIEGLDYDVLMSADFKKSAPIIICVETRIEETTEMIHMLMQKGFTYFCRMGENLIFVRDDKYKILNPVWDLT